MRDIVHCVFEFRIMLMFEPGGSHLKKQDQYISI